MAENTVKKIATRESYGNALVELGTRNPDVVVLDSDLAEATKTGVFKKAFPDRHIDCGIAEGNMVGVAAGLATTGKIPFVSSFSRTSSRLFVYARFTSVFCKSCSGAAFMLSACAGSDVSVTRMLSEKTGAVFV